MEAQNVEAEDNPFARCNEALLLAIRWWPINWCVYPSVTLIFSLMESHFDPSEVQIIIDLGTTKKLCKARTRSGLVDNKKGLKRDNKRWALEEGQLASSSTRKIKRSPPSSVCKILCMHQMHSYAKGKFCKVSDAFAARKCFNLSQISFWLRYVVKVIVSTTGQYKGTFSKPYTKGEATNEWARMTSKTT